MSDKQYITTLLFVASFLFFAAYTVDSWSVPTEAEKEVIRLVDAQRQTGELSASLLNFAIEKQKETNKLKDEFNALVEDCEAINIYIDFLESEIVRLKSEKNAKMRL